VILKPQLSQVWVRCHNFPRRISNNKYIVDVYLTIIHLLPSSFITGGFFVRMLSGFGFFPGAGLFPRDIEETLEALSLRVGTVAPARNEGFLCVIWSGFTFRSPFVTASPLFNSLKTASIPPAAAGAALGASSNLIGGGGGPGGGGGGGGPPADFGCGAGGRGSSCSTALIASPAETP
jgi:hypothetical protein